GTRFAIIHADATSAATKPNVSIYNIEPTKIVLMSMHSLFSYSLVIFFLFFFVYFFSHLFISVLFACCIVDVVETFEQRLANHLYWSPNGRFLLLAGLKTMNGQLEFIDVDTLERYIYCFFFLV